MRNRVVELSNYLLINKVVEVLNYLIINKVLELLKYLKSKMHQSQTTYVLLNHKTIK